jgi:hypothetical protein
MASWATDEWKIERDSDLIVKKKLVTGLWIIAVAIKYVQ